MGYRVPFQQTAAGCALAGAEHWNVRVRGTQVGVQAFRSRVLPWLRIARVPNFGRKLPSHLARPVVEALVGLARERPVLRLTLQLWSEDDDERERLADACRSAGLHPVRTPQSYTRTIWMDLAPPEQQIFAGLHATARRHIRALPKKGYEVRPITDPATSRTLDRILHETFARTGTEAPRIPWARAIRISSAEPDTLRILGTFRAEDGEGRAPLGFVVAAIHGDVAEYLYAGSVRHPGTNVPILYAPTWDLIMWARHRGARWWDFGGIPDHWMEDDRRRGIADFKRYFSTAEKIVGEEWLFEPRKLASLVAGLPSRLWTFRAGGGRAGRGGPSPV